MISNAERILIIAEVYNNKISSKAYDFLKAKYGGGKPTSKDVKLIESLLVDQKFNPGVVNVLIDYVLRINENKLNKNFVEAIASHWKLSKIDNVKKILSRTSLLLKASTKRVNIIQSPRLILQLLQLLLLQMLRILQL